MQVAQNACQNTKSLSYKIACKGEHGIETFSIEGHLKFSCLACYLSPYLSGFLLQSDRLKQVKTTETACWDLAKGDRDRLVEVTV